MADFAIMRPAPLLQVQGVARRSEGGLYDPDAVTAEQYVSGDIITLRNTDGIVKETEAATAGNIASLAVAGQNWLEPQAEGSRFDWWRERGVQFDIINEEDEWLMTLAGDFDAPAALAVRQQEQRDILFDATAGVLTVRATTSSVGVRLLRPFNGAVVGDTNIPVVVKFLRAKLAT